MELSPFLPIMHLTESPIRSADLIRYNISHITDVCTLPTNSTWDFVCILSGHEEDHIMLMQDSLAVRELDTFENAGRHRAVLLGGDTLLLMSEADPPVYLSLGGDRIRRVTHEDIKIQMVYDVNEKMIGAEAVPAVQATILVYDHHVLLRTAANDRRVTAEARIVQYCVVGSEVFLLGDDGGLRVVRLAVESDGKLKAAEMKLVAGVAMKDRRVASFHIEAGTCCIGFEDGYLGLFSVSGDSFKQFFSAHLMSGPAHVVDARQEPYVKYVSSCSIKKVKLARLGGLLCVLVYTSASDIWVYRQDQDKLVRVSANLTARSQPVSGTGEEVFQVSRLNGGAYIVSGQNVHTSVIMANKGEVFVHRVKGLKEGAVFVVGANGDVVSKDDTGKVRLVRLVFPEPFCPLNTYPFSVFRFKDMILRTVAIQREDITGLVMLCKTRLGIADTYKLLLFDLNGMKILDRREFDPMERVVSIKKIQMEVRNQEVEEMLYVMYVSHASNTILSKSRLIRLRLEETQGVSSLRFDAREDYHDQESNEIITSVFNIGDNMFLCIDNRIVQMQLQTAGNFKLIRTYYPNASFIVDSCVKDNNVILTNLYGSVIFMIWIKDQNKLKQKNECVLGNDFLYFGRFIDSRQAKVDHVNSDR